MSEEKVNLEEIQQKLYEKLKESGWADVLKGFLLSDELTVILEQLYKEQQAGERFTPSLKQVFNAFEKCPYKDLKVVMMGQDPYPYPSVCDGLAFSCSNDGRIQASLRYIHGEIKQQIYPNQAWKAPADLSVWAKQGVLLTNIALTTTIGKIGTHYLLWRPFIAYLLDQLGWNNPGLVWVFVGAKARDYAKGIPDNCYKLYAVHPAYAAHMKLPTWDSEGLFLKIREKLRKEGKLDIVW